MGDEQITILLVAKDQAGKVLKALGKTAVETGKVAQRGLARISAGLKKVRDTARSAVSGGLKRFASFLKRTLTPGIGQLVLAIGGLAAIVGFTRQAGEFRTAMAEVATIVDTTTVSIDGLREGVLDLARAQGTNEKIVAKGLYQAISAGVDAGADSLRFLGEANKLAIAGLAETSETVDLLTSVQNAYNKTVEDTADISDIAFTAVRKGKTTITELAASMGQVTPIAASLRVEIDELFAATAAVTLGGVRTAEAVTQIRSAMVALLKQGEAINDLFQERLGKTFNVTDVRTRGLVAVLGDLRLATRGNQDELTQLLGRVEAVNAVLNLTGDAGARFADVMGSMAQRAGAAGKAFDKNMADPARRVGVAMNSLRIVFVEMGDRILVRLADAIENLRLDRLRGTFSVIADVVGDLAQRGIGGLESALRALRSEIDKLGGPERVGDIIKKGFDVVESGAKLVFATIRFETQAVIRGILLIPEALDAAVNAINPLGRRTRQSLEKELANIQVRLDDKGLNERSRQAALTVQRSLRAQLEGAPESREGIAAKLLGITESAAAKDAERYASGFRAAMTAFRDEIESEPIAVPVTMGGSVGTPDISDPAVQAGTAFAAMHRTVEMVAVQMALIATTTRGVTSETESGTRAIKDYERIVARVKSLREDEVVGVGRVNSALTASLFIARELVGALSEDELAALARIGTIADQNAAALERMRVAAIRATDPQSIKVEALAAGFDLLNAGIRDLSIAAVDSTRSIGDAFKDMARRVVAAILEMTIKFLAFKALAAAFPGLFGNGGVSENPIKQLLGFAQGGSAQGVVRASKPLPFKAFARGGIATEPTLALLGENKKFKGEAFVPLPDGKNIPVEMKGGGGTVQNITMAPTFELHVVDRRGFQELLAEEKETIEDMMMQATIHGRREFRTAFQLS